MKFFSLPIFSQRFFLFLFLAFILSTSLQGEIVSAALSDEEEREAEAFFMEEHDSIRNFKPWLENDHATENWFGIRDDLSKEGIDLGFSSINDVWGNTTGGIKTGSVYLMALQAATAVDLEKFIHWKGGSFYSRWLYLAGEDPGTNLVGNMFGISNLAGYSTFRNVELWLQQNFLEDKISLRVGQLAADSEFVISDYGALFLNSTFGWPAFMFTSLPNGGPAYPVGVPGVRLKLQPNGKFSFKAAAFQGNVFPQNVNNHGFTWNLNSNQGYSYLNEVTYRYKQYTLPGQIKAGSWLSSSTFPNLSNQNNSLWGNYGIYGILDQMIYRSSSEEKSDKGLGFFNRIAFEPGDRNILNFYCDTGLNYKGLIPSRDQDLLGLACGYGLLSNSGINSIQQNQGTAPANTTFDIELTYQALVTPWFTLQPDLQYVIHPGTTQLYPNALAIGLRATVTF